MVGLDPVALARFSLSEDLLSLISTNRIIISCRAINIQPKAVVNKSTAQGQDERYSVNMEIDGASAVSLSMLNLPEGQYEIHYRIMQYVEGTGVIDDLIYEGTATTTLQKGQVTEIPIP